MVALGSKNGPVEGAFGLKNKIYLKIFFSRTAGNSVSTSVVRTIEIHGKNI